MLEFKIIEELNPNVEILQVINKYSYKIKKGQIKKIINTNIEFVKPTEYLITKPTTLTILEYKINEFNNKTFFIKEHNQKYNLKEIKNILKNLTTTLKI